VNIVKNCYLQQVNTVKTGGLFTIIEECQKWLLFAVSELCKQRFSGLMCKTIINNATGSIELQNEYFYIYVYCCCEKQTSFSSA